MFVPVIQTKTEMKRLVMIAAIAAAALMGAQNVQAQSVVDGKNAEELKLQQKELKKKEKILKNADKARANVLKAEKKVESTKKALESAQKKAEQAVKDLEKARKKAEEADREVANIQSTAPVLPQK
jgi:septal ring factor EnvC (AmiA/AmiB activator)